jgi:lysophospholipase L1-like esterase
MGVFLSVQKRWISSNAVVSGGLGPTTLKRFNHDVLYQNRAHWAIILEGGNDIGDSRSPKVAADLIAAYEQSIEKAHANNILVYGVLILPFGRSV